MPGISQASALIRSFHKQQQTTFIEPELVLRVMLYCFAIYDSATEMAGPIWSLSSVVI